MPSPNRCTGCSAEAARWTWGGTGGRDRSCSRHRFGHPHHLVGGAVGLLLQRVGGLAHRELGLDDGLPLALRITGAKKPALRAARRSRRRAVTDAECDFVDLVAAVLIALPPLHPQQPAHPGQPTSEMPQGSWSSRMSTVRASTRSSQPPAGDVGRWRRHHPDGNRAGTGPGRGRPAQRRSRR